MDAVETLMNEHRLIERACDALVAFADEVRRKAGGGGLRPPTGGGEAGAHNGRGGLRPPTGGGEAGAAGDDKAELLRFVTFIRDFADACHHGKEEDILFKAMIDAGFPRHGGPIAVMLQEHDMGREHVAVLKALSERKEPWTAEDRQKLADAAYGYANLLRQHIHKEDAILYPMAEQRLPPEVMERVSRDCERYEAEKTGSGEHERLHQLGAELVSRYAGAMHPAGDDPHGH